MKPVQMLQRILCVHHIVKHDKRGPFRLGFVAQSDLPNPTVPPEQVVQVVACDGV